MTLSALGFVQYIGPTIMLLLSVFVFKESVSAGSAHRLRAHLDGARSIWCGIGSRHENRKGGLTAKASRYRHNGETILSCMTNRNTSIKP